MFDMQLDVSPAKMSENSQLVESLLANSGSVPNFFNNIFSFLAARSDFYQIANSPDEPGLPPGVAESMVIKAFYKSNPNILYSEQCDYSELFKRNDPSRNNIFLPAGLAQEVEVGTTDSQDVECFTVDLDETPNESCNVEICTEAQSNDSDCKNTTSDLSGELKFASLNINCKNKTDLVPNTTNIDTVLTLNEENVSHDKTALKDSPIISPQNVDKLENENSESFNGAVRDNYSWSQNISELDITIKSPEGVTSSKHLKINIKTDSMSVEYLTSNKSWSTLIKDNLSYKIKSSETVWVMSEGFIRIHMEKQAERWWSSLLENEPKIDTSKLNCSRPLHDLSDDHIAKIQELRWNHMQKLEGKPTSDEITREKVLERAWNAPGSPFLNTPYDPKLT